MLNAISMMSNRRPEFDMLAGLRSWLTARRPDSVAPSASATAAPGHRADPAFQGYLDERSTHHVRGWLRDCSQLSLAIPFEVVVTEGAGERVLVQGVADQANDVLDAIGVGQHGFFVAFDPPLARGERDRVHVRPINGDPLAHAPAFIARRPGAEPFRIVGYVDECSESHVAGWTWNEADPAEHLDYEILHNGHVIYAGIARDWAGQLVRLGIGDGRHAFRVLFDEPIIDPAALQVRIRDTSIMLPMAPSLSTAFHPIGHVAMDITDNCNLRCPFCTFDHAPVRTTRLMSDATFQSALRLLPFVTEANFWLSCLHEATIHPALLRFIDMVPHEHRDRLMYTTNLAKRMPDAYFAQIGASGMHHLNISFESLEPAIYERLRKGARLPIFQSNWDKLLAACRTGPAPPRLRYNLMAYRSNLRELPSLVDRLLADKQAWQVEVRYTFDEPHIPDSFRQAEYLRDWEWRWLERELAHHDPQRVFLIMPPSKPLIPAVPSGDAGPPDAIGVSRIEEHGPGSRPSYPLGMRVDWDGTLTVYSETVGPDGTVLHTNHAQRNLNEIGDVRVLLAELLT